MLAFDRESVHVGFEVSIVTVEQVFLRVRRFPLVITISPILNIKSYITDAMRSLELTASLYDTLKTKKCI
jgi:hypothetical protein